MTEADHLNSQKDVQFSTLGGADSADEDVTVVAAAKTACEIVTEVGKRLMAQLVGIDSLKSCEVAA